jgi:sulfur carrier protein ThiS
MNITVKLHGLLRPYHPGPNRSIPMLVEVSEGASPRDVIKQLALPAELARMVVVNDTQATLDTALVEGDRLAFFTVIVGG